MQNLKFFVLPALLLLLSGCTQQPTINVDTPPKMQVQKQVEAPVKKKGSLYSRKGASLFADKKDLQIGDIIKINISETVENESTASRNIKRDNTLGLNAASMTAPNNANPVTGQLVRSFNNTLGVGLSASTSKDFKTSSDSEVDEEFTTTISAIIEQTYQNGNYFVKGSKEILINGQKQVVRISGIIRPYDISPENEISSGQMANLKIYYEKLGEEMDALKKPWGSKVIESIWPF